MPITIIQEKGCCCPKAICDVCGEPVQKYGNIEWMAEEGFETSGVLYCSHKECSHELRARFGKPGAMWMWEDLDCFLVFLVENSRINWKRAKERAKLFATMS
jgi:hypothetical protein